MPCTGLRQDVHHDRCAAPRPGTAEGLRRQRMHSAPNTYKNLYACCCCAAGTDALERNEAGSKGITPRAIAQVFRELRRRQLANWEVGVTYVQVYNEAFQDLLCPETPEADIAVSDQRHIPPLILFMHPSRSLARSTFGLLLPRPFNGHADSKSTHCS